MRKTVEIIGIAAVFVGFCVGLLFWLPKNGADITVGVEACEGMQVVGESVVTARYGDTVSFVLRLDEGVEFLGTDGDDVYENGVLSVCARAGRTVRVRLAMPADIEIKQGDIGTLRVRDGMDENGKIHIGKELTFCAEVPTHYTLYAVMINGVEYPAKADGTVSLIPTESIVAEPVYRGEEVQFRLGTSRLGEVTDLSGLEAYRYGDTVVVRAEYNPDKVAFSGWSIGAEQKDGGETVSTETEYTCVLDGDCALFANFVSLSTYYLSYDAAGGSFGSGKTPERTVHSAGEYITLPVDNLGLSRAGYLPKGYSDGESFYYFGSMMLMPERDVVLTVVWQEVSPEAWFTYKKQSGGITILGFSEAGKAAACETLVLPQTIDGQTVVAVAEGAFNGNTFIKTVALPVGLKTVGAYAFANCPLLKEVCLPETLTALSDDAFTGSNAFSDLRVHASLEKVYDIDYDSSLADKYMHLKETEGQNRIIFVGGSGCSFGIESDIVKEAFPDYAVVNFSTSVYYGIRPLLAYLANSVHEGDIVVFALEYRNYMYGSEVNLMTNWQYLESNYNMLCDLDIRDNTKILKKYIEYLDGKRGYLSKGKKKYNSRVYSRAAFDRDGDLNIFRNGVSASRRVSSSVPEATVLTEKGLAYLYDGMAKLKARGAQCYLSYPAAAMPDGYTKETVKQEAAAFVTKLEKALENVCTPISEIEDYYLPHTYNYDTMYHLSTEGARVRTQQLVKDMQNAGIQ